MPSALTARFVDQVKPKPGQRLTFSDAIVEGLELRVGSAGSKTWSLRLRTIGGKRSRMSLGRYPQLSLADARERALKAITAALDGHNPAEDRKAEKVAARSAERTVKDLAEDFFASPEAAERADSTNAHERSVWRLHLNGRVGDRPLKALTRAEIRACVREIASSAGHRTANYGHAVLRRIYNYGIREELLDANPAQFPLLFKLASRERVLTEAEVRGLWNVWAVARFGLKLGVARPTAIALQLCLATVQRAGEVAGMHADELDWKTNSWTLPGNRTKNRRSHHVPLSPLSRRLIHEALYLATAIKQPDDPTQSAPKELYEYRGYVFPGADGKGPIERGVVTRAMTRVCAKLKIEDASTHDLRRTGASMMASERCGIRGEVISRLLNHTPMGTPITQVYNRYDYATEKRAALDLWSETLLSIANGTSGDETT